MRDERTAGRGYQLPHPENLLVQDVARLREMIQAVDDDYTELMRSRDTFQAHADEAFEELNTLMENIKSRQDSLADDTGQKLQAMKDDIGEALRKAEGRVEEIETRSGEIFAEIRKTQEETASDFGALVDEEILKLKSTVPQYDNVEGTPFLASSTLPRGYSGLEYVSGLGFFRYDPDATDPPDGETCVMPAGGAGRWLLAVPDLNWVVSAMHYVNSYPEPEEPEEPVFLRASGKLTFGAIAAAKAVTKTLAVEGAVVGEFVVAAPSSTLVPGLVFRAWVSAADTVSVEAQNLSSAAITPAAMTWDVVVFKKEAAVND